MALRCRHAKTVGNGGLNHKLTMLYRLRRFLNLKDIKIASLVPNLQPFCWVGGFCLLVDMHRDGSARSLNKSNLFNVRYACLALFSLSLFPFSIYFH